MTVKASELKGRAVLTLSDAARVGHVDEVLFDATMRHIIGFRIKTGLFGKAEAVNRANVSAVGRDAVTIESSAAINDENRLPDLANAKTLGQAQGTRVVSEGGELIGTVADIHVDDEARSVTAYQLSAPLWDRLRHQEPMVSAQRVVRLGEGGIMIVPNEVAESLRPK